MSASQEAGYEEAQVTTEARIWSWVVLVILLIGVYGGALAGSFGLMNNGMKLSFVVVVVGYIVITVRTARRTGAKTVAGLPKAAWLVLLFMLVMNVTNTLYAVLNTPLWGLHSMVSHWDQYVPTIPIFVVPYLGLYVVLFATQGFFAFRQLHRQLRTYLIALSLAMGTALFTFILFQTYVPTGPDDLSGYSMPVFGEMLKFTNYVWYDSAWYSAFPSMHCGFATVFAITWYRRKKPIWSTLMILLSVSIVIATQVLHEHVLMDALFGIVTATAAYSAAWFWSEYLPALRRERRVAESASEPPVASAP